MGPSPAPRHRQRKRQWGRRGCTQVGPTRERAQPTSRLLLVESRRTWPFGYLDGGLYGRHQRMGDRGWRTEVCEGLEWARDERELSAPRRRWVMERYVPVSPITLKAPFSPHYRMLQGRAALTSSVSMDKNVIFHPFITDATRPTIMSQKRYLKTLTSLTLAGRSYALSGGEDEDLHLWDVSGLPADRPKVKTAIEGHSGEISRVLSLGGIRGQGWVAVSTALDGTIRRWTAQGEPIV